MPDPDPLAPRNVGKFGCLGVLGWVSAAALLTVALTLLLFWRQSVEITEDARRMAESIAAGFDRTLNFTPQISVDSIVIVAANTPVLELVTLQKQALVRHRWTHTWLYSTKEIEIEATFTARAGFDLRDPIRINIDPRTRFVSADLPPPKLLSLGMGDVRVLQDEDGLWNKLTAQDREGAFRALEEKASERFAKSSLLAEARIEGEKRIRQLIDKTAWPTGPTTKPSKPLP
ncbi:MAG TPA: DUF4230 domain-containing protein [Terrimicrobiaceae bacterium]